MTGKLLVYWAPTHGRPDEDYFRALLPANILILDPDVAEISRAYQASPDSTITLRRWEWDDNRSDANPDGIYGDLARDPVGLANRHVAQFTAWFNDLMVEARRRGLPFPQREQLIASLVNEPDSNILLRQINDYTVAACDGFRKVGIVAEALKLGTGHPAILNANGEPDWGPLAGALAAIVRGNHIAVCHEYYNMSGIQHPDMHPWHVGRTAKWLPRGPRYLIGEFGLEQLVNGMEADHHGWIGRISAAQMAADTDWYLGIQRDDCIGARLYMTDFADRKWSSFDTRDAHALLVEVGKRHSSGARPGTPSTVYIPVVQKPTTQEPPTNNLVWPAKGTITQRFGERPEYYLSAFGCQGHNGLDIGAAQGTPVVAIAAGEIAFTGTDSDYGNYIRLWHPALSLHSFYAHLSATEVQVGQRVSAGQTIGRVGSTGNSTGPHLHWEVRLGTRDTYAQAAWGHTRGRVDPETVWVVLGGNHA